MVHFKGLEKIFESKKETPKFFPLKKTYRLYIAFQKGTYVRLLPRKVLCMDHSSNLSLTGEKVGGGVIFDNFNNYGRLRYKGHSVVRGGEKYLWNAFYNGDRITPENVYLFPN